MIVSLSWAAVTSATSYRVYRSNVSGDLSPQLIGSTPSNSWADTPPLPGTWYYVVTALDKDGESLFSTEFPAPSNAIPAIPTSLTGTITT